MTLRHQFQLLLTALAFMLAAGPAHAAPKPTKRKADASDISPIDGRLPSVVLAESLAKVDIPPTLTTDKELPQPFNPPSFGVDNRPVAGPVVKNVGDRELLAALAGKVHPNGTFGLGSKSLLSFGKKNLRPGDRLTVNFENQDYVVELVSFDRTNFTLRLNHEEITRPIKPGK